MHAGPMGKLYSLDARGKFGWSGGLGRLCLGENRLGFYHWLAGIYHKKYYYGKPYISREKFHRSPNTRQPQQQAWRAIMRSGVLSWQHLAPFEKKFFNDLAKHRPLSGYNLYLKEWLNMHKSEVLG